MIGNQVRLQRERNTKLRYVAIIWTPDGKYYLSDVVSARKTALKFIERNYRKLLKAGQVDEEFINRLGIKL